MTDSERSHRRKALELAEQERKQLEKQFMPEIEIPDSDFQLNEAVTDEKQADTTHIQKTPTIHAEAKTDESDSEEQAPENQSAEHIQEIIESGDVEAFERVLDEDFEKSRQNILRILGRSDEIIDVLIALTKESESPRAFEVLNTTLSSMIDSNKQLMEVYEKREIVKERRRKNQSAKSENDGSEKSGNYTQNNIVFNGSTADLLKHINSNNEGNDFEG